MQIQKQFDIFMYSVVEIYKFPLGIACILCIQVCCIICVLPFDLKYL